MTPKLQVLICTLGEQGLRRVACQQLPQVSGVSYLVSCQSVVLQLPPALHRPDTEVFFTPTKGLSVNRNHALSLARAPYVLIADDDLNFTPEGLEAVIRALDENPDIDIAAFRLSSPTPRTYPPAGHDLFKPYPCYWPCSAELALRLSSFRAKDLRFNPLMGIGSPRLHSGEESLMLLVAKRRGMKGRFFPVTICEHPTASTGHALQNPPGVLQAEGAIILLTYPLTFIPRLALKAHRTPGSTLRAALHLLRGAAFALIHRRQLLS